MDSERIKIGLVLGGPKLPFWVEAIIERIQGFPALDLYVVAAPEVPAESIARPEKPLGPLFSLYLQFDCKRRDRFLKRRHLADRKLNGEAFTAEHRLPNAALARISLKSPDALSPDEIDALRDSKLDLILNCSHYELPDTLAQEVRFGIWEFSHQRHDPMQQAVVGLWEVIRRESLSRVSLDVQFGEPHNGTPKAPRSRFETIELRTHATSPAINQIRLQYGSVSLFEYAIRRLIAGARTREDFRRGLRAQPEMTLRLPTTAAMAWFLLQNTIGVLTGRIRSQGKVEQWTVGLCDGSPLGAHNAPARSIRWYHPDRTHFIADPFAIERNGKLFVFVEDFPYQVGRGHIGVIEARSDGTFSEPTPVLVRDYHLSFPFLLDTEKELYLVPEQSTSNQVMLYRCKGFPERWEAAHLLLDRFPGVDTVIFQRDGLWWLFCSYGAYSNQDNNLHIFYSPDLFGEFKPHAKNPVKLGLRGSRMAGRIFEDNGRLYRPSQNCLTRYGGSIVLQEILKLTPTDFSECEVQEITPFSASPYREGLNTLNSAGGKTLITGLRYVVPDVSQPAMTEPVLVESPKAFEQPRISPALTLTNQVLTNQAELG